MNPSKKGIVMAENKKAKKKPAPPSMFAKLMGMNPSNNPHHNAISQHTRAQTKTGNANKASRMRRPTP